MHICHLKNAELESQFQKYKGRVVLRGDIVKDNSGACAVFTEQGSSAFSHDGRKCNGCHCSSTRLWWTSSRRNICLYPSKNGGCSKVAQKFRSQKDQTYGYTFQDTNGRNRGPVGKTQWFPLRELLRTPTCWTLMEETVRRKFCWNLDGKKYQIGNTYLFTEDKSYSYQYTWTTSKWLERTRMAPMLKKLMEKRRSEPTSFLGHVYLGCTGRECKPNDAIVEKNNKMFESHISAGATEKLPWWEKPHAKTVAWSYDMEGHAQKMRGKILRTGK